MSTTNERTGQAGEAQGDLRGLTDSEHHAWLRIENVPEVMWSDILTIRAALSRLSSATTTDAVAWQVITRNGEACGVNFGAPSASELDYVKAGGHRIEYFARISMLFAADDAGEALDEARNAARRVLTAMKADAQAQPNADASSAYTATQPEKSP